MAHELGLTLEQRVFGSHRAIMQHWDRVLAPERRSWLPRCHGMRIGGSKTAASYPEGVPPTDGGGGWNFSESEPMPVVVERGTAQVGTPPRRSGPGLSPASVQGLNS